MPRGEVLNEPVRITKNSWIINGDASDDDVFLALLKNSDLKENQRFIHSQYEALKSRFLSLASRRGYHDAHFNKHDVEIDVDKNTANIDVIFESGQRYRFGSVTFEQDILNDDLLQRFVPFEQGDGYTSQELSNLQVALLDSGYFSQVQVSPRWNDSEEHHVPVDVKSTANYKNQYQYGDWLWHRYWCAS